MTKICEFMLGVGRSSERRFYKTWLSVYISKPPTTTAHSNTLKTTSTTTVVSTCTTNSEYGVTIASRPIQQPPTFIQRRGAVDRSFEYLDRLGCIYLQHYRPLNRSRFILLTNMDSTAISVSRRCFVLILTFRVKSRSFHTRFNE